MLARSTITSKGQTTIPLAVRQRLGLQPGDEIAFREEGDRIVVLRVTPEGGEDPFVSFDEWAGDADERAYERL